VEYRNPADTRPAALDRRDVLLLVGILLLGGVLVSVRWSPGAPPAEDAAILLRYSQHLAEGHGIVWNIGEKPVDGATDFLLVVVVAGLHKTGVSLEGAVEAVGLGSHLATIVLIYLAVRRIAKAGRWAAGLSAGYLAVGPACLYINAGFGTPFFALLACTTWCLGALLLDGKPTVLLSLLFSLSGLTLGLIRPEGVILAGLIVAGLVVAKGWKDARGIVFSFLAVFLLLGGAYFVWHWMYFGYPLPNPFYKKGGGILYPRSLGTSVLGVVRMCLPFLPVFALGLRTAELTRRLAFTVIPVAGFTAAWALVSDEMNFANRFQYAVLPIVLVSWPSFAAGLGEATGLGHLVGWTGRRRFALAVGVATAAVMALAYPPMVYRNIRLHGDGRYEVGRVLSRYADRGYTAATTEAGLVSLYSRWRVIDTWGLNDAWIAHHGAVTEEYLDRFRPEVIASHAYFTPGVEPVAPGPYGEMTEALERYAVKNGYVLAACYARNARDSHYYYVRADFAESREIVEGIRGVDYTDYMTGTRCMDCRGSGGRGRGD